MLRRFSIASAVTAVVAIAAAGVVLTPQLPDSDRAESMQVQTASRSADNNIDPDAFSVASSIAEELAIANSEAFRVPAEVDTEPISTTLASKAGRTPAEHRSKFAARLALDDEANDLGLEAAAVEKSEIEVTSVTVAVEDAVTEAQDDETDRVTFRLYTAREMRGLPTWEESTYYVATVDSDSGVIDALEVHDEFWYQENPDALAQDFEALPPASSDDTAQLAALTGAQKANVVVYADRHWSNYNTAAYSPSPNDCTNFISQALYYGGWAKVGTDYTGANRASNSVWWWTSSSSTYPKSYSWADAQYWKNFATGSGRVTAIGTSLARSGDVIQYDIGLNGMNHTTVVTFYDTSTAQPLLTYHTSNTHNKPLSAFQASVAAEANGQSYQLYAWRT